VIEILKKARIIICVGSGGVGKTTVASALAFAAAKMGRHVLVLTVDPAKRLKSTMGLEGENQHQILHPQLKGNLTAAIIDSKKVFDDFVLNSAKDLSVNDETIDKVFQNKLYIQLSTNLSGSQEFTALEKLYESFDSKKYDLIVLDTPPTKHAIDFLNAPQKLMAIFNPRITSWLESLGTERKDGFFRGLLMTGTKTVLRALESLTGTEFIRELADFFRHIQKLQGRLEERINGAYRLLINSQTHFFLVTNFDEAKLKEAEHFSKEIRKGGFQLSAVLINRAYPKGLDLTNENVDPLTPWGKLFNEFQKYTVAKRKLFEKFSMRSQCVLLPELLNNISDLEGVAEMAQNILVAESKNE
jgi:anion-transporting  ArsA/GET3 family ATPase